jgi:hypothetical protein
MKKNQWKLAAAFLGAMVLTGNAQAGKLGVRVLDANSGLPVANASVCLGTASEPTKYGTAVTSYSGLALYDEVPQKTMLITVSKKNFRGIALQAPVRGNNVIKDVLVTEGLSSKKCRALKMVDFKPGISRTTGPWQLPPCRTSRAVMMDWRFFHMPKVSLRTIA